MKINESKKITVWILALIFVLMLGCNYYTEEIADDFSYHFSWYKSSVIDSFDDLFLSMGIHWLKTNGRVVAHFLVHIFELLPKGIFNVVNSLLFTAMIAMIYHISSGAKRNNALLLTIFGATWIFTPAFGQVFLWLDGSCNYLWGMMFGLVYLLPFVQDFLYDRPVRSKRMQAAIVVFAVFMGAYSENGSAAFIFMSALIQLARVVLQGKPWTRWGLASLATACAGYFPMVLAPGTVTNKGGNWSLQYLRENFINALEQYRLLELLLIAFCVTLVLASMNQARRERICLAVICFLGSVVANFMMTAAAYYPERSMLFSTMLLILADGILFAELFDGGQKALVASASAVIALYTVFFLIIGLNDIYVTGSHLKANEAYIISCREQGTMDVRVPMLRGETKYSALNGLMYLSTEATDVWPNKSMARFFEVDTIIGYWK